MRKAGHCTHTDTVPIFARGESLSGTCAPPRVSRGICSLRARSLPGTARQLLPTGFPRIIAGLGSAPPGGPDRAFILGIHRLDIKDNRNALRLFQLYRFHPRCCWKNTAAAFRGASEQIHSRKQVVIVVAVVSKIAYCLLLGRRKGSFSYCM